MTETETVMKSDLRFTGRFLGRLLLAVAFVLATQSAQAQVLYGSLVGQVADPSRAVLPGATVTVTNKDTHCRRLRPRQQTSRGRQDAGQRTLQREERKAV